ncbi:MAG: alkaline shock response membrane anchor protein AmaP [Syntrophomonadaceae bacterium]|jgi:uncharacterized alkaline shock family protein YloU
MKVLWRLVLLIYNLGLLVLAGFALVAAMGRPEPVTYISQAMATPQNRIIVGIIAILAMVAAIAVIFSVFKTKSESSSYLVSKELLGEICITVPAIKLLIMKAVHKVEGVKEVRPSVHKGSNGVIIKIHTLINPDYPVPELSKKVQETVKKQLEELGGLQVDEVRILTDDFNTGNKQAGI